MIQAVLAVKLCKINVFKVRSTKIAPCIVEYRGGIDKVRKEASWIAKDIMNRINTVSLSYVLQASFLLLERKNTAFLSVYYEL